MTIDILRPHGFCAGVTNALKKALSLVSAQASDPNTRTPANPNTGVFCLHELVHNELVVAELKAKGMVFVESLDEVPEGATVLFSAHGVSPAVRAQAVARRLHIVDATCPFVTRVHKAARDFAAKGLSVVILGHPDHAEVKGILGEVPKATILPDLSNLSLLRQGCGGQANLSLGLVSQTTMNADDVQTMVSALRECYPVETMAEVCHATKERQDAVKAFDGDALLVLGSANSSNTRRLCEVSRCRTFRAGTLEEVRQLDFNGISRLGVTSGASTPEDFFDAVIRELEGR